MLKPLKNCSKNLPPSPPNIEIALPDPCGLYFTSGTTGTPKPILLTHKNMVSACITENCHHYQTRKDKFILIPPLYHTGAKMHWFGSFVVGGPAVILKGISPEWILEAVSEEKGTIVWLLVPWAQDILLKLDSGEMKLEDYRSPPMEAHAHRGTACSSFLGETLERIFSEHGL